MERTNHGDVQTGGFLQQSLYLRPVFSDDVEVVTAGFVYPFPLMTECAELAESIGREQDFLAFFIRQHHFRPVYHRRHDKFQGMLSQTERVALLDGLRTSCEVDFFKKLRHHLDGLGTGYDCGLGIFFGKPSDVGRMVRFHVLHDEIIRRPSLQGFFQTSCPFVRFTLVYRVHHGYLFVRDNV